MTTQRQSIHLQLRELQCVGVDEREVGASVCGAGANATEPNKDKKNGT